jgi:hypothetical protein
LLDVGFPAKLLQYAVLYEQICAFLKVNKFFKRLTIDAENVSLLLLNSSVSKRMDHVAVMAHHTPVFCP